MNVFFLIASTWLLIAQAATTPAPTPSVVATPNDEQQRMELAEKVNGLHGMDIPWHLKASFEILAADGKTSDRGTYEEWRVNDTQYRIAFHSPSISAEEFGTDQGIFRTGAQPWPRHPLSFVTAMFAQPVSPPEISENTVFENYQRSFGAEKLLCTALKKRGIGQTSQNSLSYCFAPTNAVVFYASTPNGLYQTLFEHIKLVHGQYVAYDIQTSLGGIPWLKIHIDQLDALGKADFTALRVPAGASPAIARLETLGDSEQGHLIDKVVPRYPLDAQSMGVQGIVILDGVINTQGHFTDLQVVAGPQKLRQSAIDAVSHWVYKPFTRNGQPVELETDVNVVFSLGR